MYFSTLYYFYAVRTNHVVVIPACLETYNCTPLCAIYLLPFKFPFACCEETELGP